MDHINSVRAALKAASVNGTPPPVLAIPIPGHAPVCIRTQLLKGALKGVTIDSVALLENGWVKITGMAGRVHTSCSLVPMERWKALQAIREWSIREHQKRVKIINQGVLSAQAQRELKKKQIEGEADEVLIEARMEETRILAAAKAHINPAMEPVSEERRQSIIESYAAFRAQRGTRKRGAVIRWKLAKLRKEKAAMVKVQHVYDEVPSTLYRRRHKTLKSKVTVLRRKKDAVRYAALIYQIGKLEKQYESLYPDRWVSNEYIGNGGYSIDSWIDKRPKDQTVNTKDWWRGQDETDSYSRKDEAQRLKEARANIRALTPPEDETEEMQAAA
jgi:hypothetical protein